MCYVSGSICVERNFLEPQFRCAMLARQEATELFVELLERLDGKAARNPLKPKVTGKLEWRPPLAGVMSRPGEAVVFRGGWAGNLIATTPKLREFSFDILGRHQI